MNALEMALEALTNPSTIAVQHAIDLLREELAKPEQEPVKKALRLKPHECICGYSVGHPLVAKCICKPEYTAQLEQEPVAWMCENAVGYKYFRWKKPPNHFKSTPLYTTSPRKPWVGLTDEEAQDIAKRLVDDVAYCSTHYAIAIEVALRKKNERN